VLDQLFQVLEPAPPAATAKAMTEAEQQWRASLAVFETAVERARFDAGRAMRQYDAVEPENRLVARTLERALEDKLTTLRRAGHDLAAPRITLYRWLREGFITGEQIIPGAPWHIRIDQALRDKVQPQAPDGWLPVDQAAKALGLSRTTVFQKVRDGQLPATHVSNGQRQSLRIQVKPEAAGLFDTPK
jgi:excisionase family DNA binding protein